MNRTKKHRNTLQECTDFYANTHPYDYKLESRHRRSHRRGCRTEWTASRVILVIHRRVGRRCFLLALWFRLQHGDLPCAALRLLRLQRRQPFRVFHSQSLKAISSRVGVRPPAPGVVAGAGTTGRLTEGSTRTFLHGSSRLASASAPLWCPGKSQLSNGTCVRD